LNAVVNNSGAAGDTTVITPGAGQKVRVHGYAIQAAGNTNVTFKSGTNALTGPLSASGSSSGIVSGYNPDGWFVGAPGEAFIVNSSGAVQVSGHVEYSLL
jgi:hypothetical protein